MALEVSLKKSVCALRQTTLRAGETLGEKQAGRALADTLETMPPI